MPPNAKGAAAEVLVESVVESTFDGLTPAERAYCLGRANPHQRAAARCAAKLAVARLLARLGRRVAPDALEIVAAPALLWSPSLRCAPTQPRCRSLEPDLELMGLLARVELSLTHIEERAASVALLGASLPHTRDRDGDES